MKLPLSLLILSLSFQITAAAETPSEKVKLKNLIKIYQKGDCQTALVGFKNLLYPLKRLKNKEDELLARQYLAFCYFLTGQKEEAKFEFVKLLKINPTHQLNPTLVLPEVLEIYEEAKKIRSLIEAEIKKAKVEQGAKKIPLTFTHFLPFGFPQFKNHQRGKGYLFLASQLVFFTLSFYFYYQLQQDYHPQYLGYLDPEKALANQKRVRICFWGGILSYLGGVVDGLFYLKKTSRER